MRPFPRLRRLPAALSRALLALVALALTARAPLAQQLAGRDSAPRGAGAGPAAAATTVAAVRAAQAPAIDGREDDTVWGLAVANADFFEFQPSEGKAPRFRTEFKTAYDDRNLYVFIRAYDPHPDSIMTALSRRDVRAPSDQLKIMIDAYDDRRTGIELAVNPVGVKRDYAIYNDSDEDDSWDGVWDVSTRIDSLGWTAEFRVPLSQLRYTKKDVHRFGFGIWRDIERYKERTSWPAYKNQQGTLVSQFGHIEGITGIAPFHRLEVTPYAVTKNVSVAKTGTVPAWDRSQKISAGADVKYGITPNLTLDATVNPDFGQVEADPAVLNLSAFETFFQERRPFFVEGSGLYSFSANCNVVNCSGEGLFYSRRIGRAPQLFGQYADDASPNVTPILGAAKLTGRLPSGMNVGVLEAVTERVTGTEDRTTEPRTNYAVLRAKQDFRGGDSDISFIGTSVNRSLDEWSRDYLRSDAYATGVSTRHRFANKQYEISGSVMASQVRGSEEAIASTQRSSAHLYQRPDDDLTVDPTRTSLGGDAEEIQFGKIGGRLFRFQTSYQRQSPGFEINDLGFLRRANQQSWSNWAQLSLRTPTKVYRQANANFNYWSYWTASGLATEKAFNTNWHVNLTNNMWVHVGGTIGQLPGTFSDDGSRGGPAYRRSPIYSPWVGFDGDDRKRIVPHLFVNFGSGDYGRTRWRGISPSLEFRPMSQLQAELGLDMSRNHDDSQWLGNFTDETTGVTHYAFARLEQETRSLSTRISYTATPTLSLQLYAQPFWSRGTYMNARQLSATPRAVRYEDRFAAYAPPEETSMGFDFMQLRSTSVVRWEFRPGSALYAVWTHGREGFDGSYASRPWRDEYSDLFALRPDNVFLIKVAYWLNR